MEKKKIIGMELRYAEDHIDKRIIEVLTESKEALTTYMLAKRVGVSWSTTQLHCYALEGRGKVEHDWDNLSNLSYMKRQLWKLKTKKVVKDGK